MAATANLGPEFAKYPAPYHHMPSILLHHKTLILFTRYPQPGATKTRLIPVLGPQGAAGLQRWMTERALAHAQAFSLHSGVALEIHYAGGEESTMRQWLGPHAFTPQTQGTVGERMAHSFSEAFRAGRKRVVIIGSDCPGITVEILAAAFSALESRDLVLGPAMDGGYYLIGLTRPHPSLFDDIAWGRESVLQQTLAKAHGLTIHHLPTLHDIDRPQDLDHLDYHPHP